MTSLYAIKETKSIKIYPQNINSRDRWVSRYIDYEIKNMNSGKFNKIFKIVVIITILIVTISLFYYYVVFLPKENIFIPKIENKISIVDETSKCLDIFEKKKDQYPISAPITVRQNVIFNEKLSTCLIFFMQNFNQKKIEMEIRDILKDKTLLFYSDIAEGYSTNLEKCKLHSVFLMYSENGEEVVKDGCEKFGLLEEASERINSFGFSFP